MGEKFDFGDIVVVPTWVYGIKPANTSGSLLINQEFTFFLQVQVFPDVEIPHFHLIFSWSVYGWCMCVWGAGGGHACMSYNYVKFVCYRLSAQGLGLCMEKLIVPVDN